MKILSIDPGKKGGLALFNYDEFSSKLTLLEVLETPCDKEGNYKICDIWELLIDYEPNLVLLEEIQPRGSCGTLNVQEMGKGEGMWLTMFELLHIPHIRINPQSWTSKLGLRHKPDKSMSKSANLKVLKLAHVDLAVALYPHFQEQFYTKLRRIKDGPADAVLIGTYWNQITNLEKQNVS